MMSRPASPIPNMCPHQSFLAGTISIQAADAEGWVASVTPSGGWIPAFVAGNTGVGLSQRMQSFVLHEQLNPYNVVAPGRLQATPLVSAHAREQLEKMGYQVELVPSTYNPTTAIWFDHEHGAMHGAASDYGDDYGVEW